MIVEERIVEHHTCFVEILIHISFVNLIILEIEALHVELTQFQSFVERIRCRRPQDVCTGRLDPTRKSNNPVFVISLL